MKRRFTILTAALALLAFLALPMGMRGQSTKTERFETATASSTYNGTVNVSADQSDCGIGWTIYYGTVSTQTPIAGSKSAQMRWYKSALSNYPYLKSTTAIEGLSNVAFEARVGNTDVKMDVHYSSDGNNWTALATAVTFADTYATDFSYDIPSGGKYIKFGVSSSSTAPNGTFYSLLIDNVVFTYSGDINTYTVTYHANVTGTSDIEVVYNEGEDVTVAANTFSNPGYAFTEWNTEADGSGTSYDPEDVIEDIDEDIDLYAQWEESDEIIATITKAKLELEGTSYSSGDKTIDDITYTYADLMPSSNNIQAKANTGTIKNSTPYPGDIISVVITHSGTARTTTINGSVDGTTWTQVATGSGSVSADFSGMGYKYFQITRGSNAAYWEKIDITYSASASSQSQSDLAITNASTDLTFDLYNNSTAQVINYTTSSTGAITITPASPTSYFSYVHDATAKTITVTPLAVTPSAQTVTISQEADENYYPGTTSFTVSVANSDPNLPGSANNPYTVAQARAAIDANTGVTGVYATGIVSENNYFSSNNGYITYFISADGSTESDQLEAFHGMSYNGAPFTSADDIQVGDSVVIFGNLMKYHNNNTGTDVYEFESGNQLVFLERPVAPAEEYTLTVTPSENVEIYTFVGESTNPGVEGETTLQVTNGTVVGLSVSAAEGYVLTLVVDGTDVTSQLDETGWFEFIMPNHDVTVTATAVEDVPPVGGNYVRITDLAQLTDGSKVIIAARHDEDHPNGYYAMPGQTTGRPVGVAFTSETSGNDEILPATITASEDTYYWTVNVTNDGYTFTNAENQMIGYTSSTTFATGGDNTAWTISIGTAAGSAMVGGYTGFVIRNGNTNNRAFAFNGNVFGAYSTSNMTGSGYNFFLDFFVQTEAQEEGYTLFIDGYADNDNPDGGYYLIASPVTVNPATAGMTDGNFDLYWFDQTEELEWRNYEDVSFNLVPGMGYLYAHDTDVTLTFAGEPTAIDPYPASLVYDDEAEFAGWNLVGNPFGETAYINCDFYGMNEDGSDLCLHGYGPGNASTPSPISSIPEGYYPINIMQGVFVLAHEDGDELLFYTENTVPTPWGGGGDEPEKSIVMNINNDLNSLVDRAIIRFGEGRQLPKLMLNEANTKLYIAEGSEEYAVVRSTNENTTPVSFHAAKNGTYTLSINTENVEMEYLHLIDNIIGADIDLLANPNYTFEANTTDYANRFALVYATTDGVNANNTKPFAFFNGSDWFINNEGEATLQVIDMTGRMLSNEQINGNYNKSLNLSAGVYVIRLSNGNAVKTQKIVID